MIREMATQMTKSIVYIEDDPNTIHLVKLILGKGGFTVTGVNTGIEGIEAIKANRPDVVLLDLMMPDMDGWEVYQMLRSDEQTKDIPVIVITARTQSIDKVMGLHIAKVDDYITKPFSPNDLLKRVKQVLENQETPTNSN